MPRVSIIVPAYNEEKFIARTLETLKNQTYRDYEIIVVNNNSTDNTEKIAKEHVDKVFLEKEKGYHNAVNRGVREAKGDIITFCDADSLYPKNWLKKIIHEFDKDSEVVAVYGTAKFHDYNIIVNFISQYGLTLYQTKSGKSYCN